MWSENGPVYIIAEAGSNHDGVLDQALELIEVAASAGADAVKFQCLAPLKHEWLLTLKGYAKEQSLDFLATPFDVDAVKTLDKLDVPAIKIASPEIVNEELLYAVAETGLPVILSTGMATLLEIDQAISGENHWLSDVALLHCTTRYPTPYEQANLLAMNTLWREFNLPIGLSDHTLGTAIPIAAAARGACIIEKHFTLDKTLPGPDHHYALEPRELRQMVEGVRQAEAALGSGEKGPQEGELVEARGRQLQWTT